MKRIRGILLCGSQSVHHHRVVLSLAMVVGNTTAYVGAEKIFRRIHVDHSRCIRRGIGLR